MLLFLRIIPVTCSSVCGLGERGSRVELFHIEDTAVLKAALPKSIRIFSLLLIFWGAHKIPLELARCKILTLLS